MNSGLVFREYQAEADNAIIEELVCKDAATCGIKMFCGIGKSLLMSNGTINLGVQLVVFVFPSLPLIEQFYTNYLKRDSDEANANILKISSDDESTTTPSEIKAFLDKAQPTVNLQICVTYQSYQTLIDNLGDHKINVCHYDEAHHVVGDICQKLIFENNTAVCEKQIFYTATPKNANGIVMYDREKPENSVCGKWVYEYTYLRGVQEEYLNPFEMRIDMYTENTNKSVLDSIARAALASGNGRVLTFHSYTETDGNTSVVRFVDEPSFIESVQRIMRTEFPDKKKLAKTKISMVGMTGKMAVRCNSCRKDTYKCNKRNCCRFNILNRLDKTSADEIMVISSCRTIGEGIDTKSANMCVFVDPKSSYIDIIQNIGRIVRKPFGVDKPHSTVLIPCWVDKDKYVEANGDREKCDEIIRQDMEKTGNFNGILNVTSALRQEDPELYDICLHYPDTYSPGEIKSNLDKQGFKLLDPIGDGEMIENLEFVTGDDIDTELYEDYENDEEMMMAYVEDNGGCIEIHSNSLETPMEIYGDRESESVVRLFKTIEEDSYDEEIIIYQPIVRKEGTQKNKGLGPPSRKPRPKTNVHTNSEVKVLWNIVGDMDLKKDICSCIIDCEIIDRTETWKIKRALICDYMDNNQGKRPNQKSKNKDEKTLGYWVSDQNKHYDTRGPEHSKFIMTDLEIHKLWTDTIANTKYKALCKIDLNQQWKDTRALICENMDNNEGKRPNVNSKNKDEKILGIWVSNQKTSYEPRGPEHSKYIMKDPEIHKLWTETIADPKYKALGMIDLNQQWKDTRALTCENMDNNQGKRPNQRSKNKDEKILGIWVSNQNTNYDPRGPEHSKERMKDPEIHKLWTDTIADPKYKALGMIDLNQQWKDTLALTCDYMDNNQGKRPNPQSKNKDEKILGEWVSTQNKKYDPRGPEHSKERMKDPEIHKLWTGTIADPKYKALGNVDLNQQWKDTRALICENMDNNEGKRPNSKSKNKDEKTLGSWVSNQNNKYDPRGPEHSKQIMKDPVIHKLWTDTIADPKYKALGRQTNSTASPEPVPAIKSMALASVSETTQQPRIESTITKQARHKSEMSVLHQKYKTLNSQNLQQLFQDKPQLFHEYHNISEENETTFPCDEIPRNRIIKKLETIKVAKNKFKTVVDMGCGKAHIANHFTEKSDSRYKFISYDHVSSHQDIEKCDIASTPLDDNEVEIAVLCLAMWGSNCRDYITEAHRILETSGRLYIIEATKRWSEKDESNNMIAGEEGNKLRTLLEETGFQIEEADVRKFSLFVCVKKA